MAASIGASRTRTIIWALFALAMLVGIIDTGSYALARVQVEDDAKAAARAAAQAVAGQPVNQETAKAAYAAADAALPNPVETVVVDAPGDAADFRLGADSSVTLTVQRPVPSLVFRHVPQLQRFSVASVTVTQQPLGF